MGGRGRGGRAAAAGVGQTPPLHPHRHRLFPGCSNDEAVALVHDTVKQPAMSAQRLVTEALARGSGDNVTCVVAFLGGAASGAERVYHAGALKYHHHQAGGAGGAARC